MSKDQQPARDRRDAGAQPWHPADDPPQQKNPGHAPIGTHSLTGGGAAVGMPQSPKSEARPERSPPPGQAEPDPLLEPRASIGEILGRKP